ncbi:MAG: 4Fe-4S dicluster domain-containing protein [Acidobacteriota bacterium]|nr:4Fe-4S dicluster domain-containing protein [Acidobacteriota bacterium]MDH3523108.1 4Fe-4S dicluster domain-containing protein [Acidobacteriota bacterium]
MERRTFLKLTAAAGATSLAGCASAPRSAEDAGEDYAVLVDLTQCAGCRMCEFACAEANGLPEPDYDEKTVDQVRREPSERQWQVVNRFETSAGEVYARRQCMHCLEPACAAGCLTKALVKTDEGPVVWRADKCMGCRYCMISCPFDGPKFEYHSPVPRIQKCQMCWERLRAGERPACVEDCPMEALVFGKRSELLELARQRIYGNPGDYVPHIYGEHEAGGTSWLYLSPVPFAELGFPTNLGTTSYPELTRDFLTAVPVVLTVWPAFLLALRRANVGDDETAGSPAREE